MLRYVLLFVVLLTTVVAQPAFQESGLTTDTLDISNPKPSTFAKGSNVDTEHIHVFNSAGYLLTPITEVNCTIHIYDNLNDHVLQQNLTADDNGVEFEINLSSTSILKKTGVYGYIIWCESINEAGFLSSEFQVTEHGFLSDNIEALIAIAILIVAFTIWPIIVSSTLKTTNSNDDPVPVVIMFKLILYAISILSAFFSLQLAISISIANSFPESIERTIGTIWWFSIIMISLGLVILLYGVASNIGVHISKRWRGRGR